MPDCMYVHMGRNTNTPVTLLVYTEEPYTVAAVDLGPFVKVKQTAPAVDAGYDAPAYTLRGRKVIANTTSGEVCVGV